MAGRAVHIAEVNPEKVNPSVVMPGNKKVEALDLQGLPSGGDSLTRTNVRSLNRRTDALERRLYSFRANKFGALPAMPDSPPG